MLTSEMLSMLSTWTSMPTGMAEPETTAERYNLLLQKQNQNNFR